MTAIVLPYDFVGGTRAIADQVDANFNALVNGFNTNVSTAISQNTTFYLSPTGSDTPTGGTSPSTPCATFNYLYSLILGTYNIVNDGAQITVQLAPGTYNQDFIVGGAISGAYNQNSFMINGNTSNPSACVISGRVTCAHGGQMIVQGITVSSATDCFFCNWGGFFQFSNVSFGNAGGNHIYAAAGGLIRTDGNYTVAGNAQSHLRASSTGSQIWLINGTFESPAGGPTVTISGNPAFSDSFAHCGGGGNIVFGLGTTFVNPTNVTGPQYLCQNNGVISTGTMGALVLPGNAPGTTARGGVYY